MRIYQITGIGKLKLMFEMCVSLDFLGIGASVIGFMNRQTLIWCGIKLLNAVLRCMVI